MENETLVLGFKGKETEFSFENKVFLIQEKVLLQNLSKPNIKNQNSEMVIKSLDDTHIADVIQIKINVSNTGYFLANFSKDSLLEDKREELLKEIATLKSDEVPTNESQLKKIRELLGILGKFSPIYVSFSNNGSIKIDQCDLEQFEVSFPLLVLEQPKKKFSIKIGETKKVEKEPKPEKIKKTKTQKEPKASKEKVVITYEPFELFDIDYLFIFIFSLLGSFAITAAVFELMNKEGIAAFLIVLGVVFTITLVIAVHSTVYKKGQLKNPWLRYYLLIFIVLGIAAGIVSSYFTCKGILKTKIENFDYKKMLLISIPISAVVLLSSVESCRLANLIYKIRQKKKSEVK